MYKLRNVPLNSLMHCVTLGSACNYYWFWFWLVLLRCHYQPHSCHGEWDCACLIIYQSLWCEMNAGQTRGGSALRYLCREWLSWKNLKERGVLSIFPFFLISLLSFYRFLHSSSSLSGTPLVPFSFFNIMFILHAFILTLCECWLAI